MPESKFDQKLHSNAEVANFLTCGDARGPSWLAKHPADLERAMERMQGRDADPLDSIRQGAVPQGALTTASGPTFIGH